MTKRCRRLGCVERHSNVSLEKVASSDCRLWSPHSALANSLKLCSRNVTPSSSIESSTIKTNVLCADWSQITSVRSWKSSRHCQVKTALVVGWAVDIPMLVRISHLDISHRPRSADPDFAGTWEGDRVAGSDWDPVVSDWQPKQREARPTEPADDEPF